MAKKPFEIQDGDVYQCGHCDGWHISDAAIKRMPWYIRLGYKLRLIRL